MRMLSEHGHFIKKINFNRPWAIGIAPDDYIITEDHFNNVLTVVSPIHGLLVNLEYVVGKKDNLIVSLA